MNAWCVIFDSEKKKKHFNNRCQLWRCFMLFCKTLLPPLFKSIKQLFFGFIVASLNFQDSFVLQSSFCPRAPGVDSNTIGFILNLNFFFFFMFSLPHKTLNEYYLPFTPQMDLLVKTRTIYSFNLHYNCPPQNTQVLLYKSFNWLHLLLGFLLTVVEVSWWYQKRSFDCWKHSHMQNLLKQLIRWDHLDGLSPSLCYPSR